MNKIPSLEMPKEIDIDYVDYELLISLSRAGFLCEPKYFERKIPFSLEDCYARQSVVNQLIIAEKNLPDGYKFKIFDGYRPAKVQEFLWEELLKNFNEKYKDLNETEKEEMMKKYVSKPSNDTMYPSVHNTGGAIDLTIVDSTGKELDMGVEFDEFTEKSFSDYYEINNISDEIRNNRRLLYNAMISAGFTNLPSEIWHYDFGDRFWAYYTNNTHVYKGVLSTSDNFLKKFAGDIK